MTPIAPVAGSPSSETVVPCAPRPYHHGDLSRALVQAGRRILETEGAAALSLRAVAREAGVSPAAPYHHFKDKTELLEAVAGEGWEQLGDAIARARLDSPSPQEALTAIGVAYVLFARQNPALYRVMYDRVADRESMPEHSKTEDSGWHHVKEAIIEAAGQPLSERDLELATVSAWCAAHGIAEMSAFKEFAPLREALGGEEPFIRALLQHVGFAHRGQGLPRP